MPATIQVPFGCKETGDCMLRSARCVPAKTYEDPNGRDMAIDCHGLIYVVEEDDNGEPIFTFEEEWEPADPSGGQYEGDGKFAGNH